ncbi:MFS transporter [Desulfonema ishimotonii]|nr:MFS transporter [Desulfonema ishimotonii]
MTKRNGTPRGSGPGWQIGAAFLSRLVINTARRFIYPFAPVLSRGLDIPLTAVASMIAVNQFTGLLSLIFGPMGDRWGYRNLMLAGMGALIIGMLIAGCLPFYTTVLVAMVLAGLSKSIFDPSILAYAGHRVPYARRGMAIGLLEISWAGSSLVGIPLAGLLIDGYGWRAPFFGLGILGVLGALALCITFPRDRRSSSRPVAQGSPGRTLKRLAGERSALCAMLFTFCISGANDCLFVTYGIWLEQRFGLSVVALGLSATVIGLAELTGEGAVATLSDRVGLKLSIITGGMLSGLCYLMLPFMGRSLPLALTGLFLLFLSFEFTIVGTISFFTELLPDARATMMSGYMASAGIGRVCGALIGGPLWMMGGIEAVGTGAALMTGAGTLFLIWGIRDWHPGMAPVRQSRAS